MQSTGHAVGWQSLLGCRGVGRSIQPTTWGPALQQQAAKRSANRTVSPRLSTQAEFMWSLAIKGTEGVGRPQCATTLLHLWSSNCFSRICRTAYHIKRRRVRPKWPYAAHTHAHTPTPLARDHRAILLHLRQRQICYDQLDQLPTTEQGGLVVTTAPRPFAPAGIQSSDSSCASRKVLSTLGVIPLNTT